VAVAIAAFVSACAFYKIPSRPLPKQESGTLLPNFRTILKDRLFFTILILLTLTGFGNYMIMPLRIEYFAKSIVKIGEVMDASKIKMIFVVIGTCTCISQVLSSIVWGKLFDRMPFIRIRVLVNAFLFSGFALFFNGKTIGTFAAAMVLTGIGLGGGEVVWRLWVTRVIGRDKLSRYMSVDAAFVGMRGVIAPHVGYFLVGHGFSYACVGNIAAGLVLCSIVGFIFLRNNPRFSRVYQ
jgi:MFS family permease